jgi:DNA-binding beta-propeller fold protein YncE
MTPRIINLLKVFTAVALLALVACTTGPFKPHQDDTAAAPKLYFVYGSFTSEGGVKVVNADGSNEMLLAAGGDVIEPDGIEVDLKNGKLYWTDMGAGAALERSKEINNGKIVRSNLDGSDIENIVPVGHTSTPKQLALDVEGGKVYWSDRGDVGDRSVNPRIMRANLDGSDVEILVAEDLISPVGIALDTARGEIYFTDRYADNIKRANLDGSGVEIVVRDTNYPVDLAIDFDTRTLYWTARYPGRVVKAPLDGTNIDGGILTPIVTGLADPIGISFDRERKRLYYTEVIITPPDGAGYIWEADMDGGNAKQILATPLPLGVFYTPE